MDLNSISFILLCMLFILHFVSNPRNLFHIIMSSTMGRHGCVVFLPFDIGWIANILRKSDQLRGISQEQIKDFKNLYSYQETKKAIDGRTS